MKVLLIHTGEESKNVGWLKSLLEEMEIPVEIFHPMEDKDLKQFISIFDNLGLSGKDRAPTHGIILSSLPKHWFDFFAGFSYGSHVPFLVYGQESIPGISEEFAPCFAFLQSEDSLHQFLDTEYEALKKQRAAEKIIRARETLLEMGVPINGESLAQCAEEGRTSEVSLFLTAGFSPDTRNKTGVPLLNLAARNGKMETLEFLVSAGAGLDLKADDRGTSALMESVMGKYPKLVFYLINAGADLNIKNKSQQTALAVAVGTGDESMVKALLEAGADSDIPDSMGMSARKYAALFRKKSIIALFDTLASE